MTAATGVADLRRPGGGGGARWATCFALVLGLHAVAVVALLRRGPPPLALPPAEDAVLLELAPEQPPMAAPEEPVDAPPEAPPAPPAAVPDPPVPPPMSQPPMSQSPVSQPPEANVPDPSPATATPPLPSPEVVLPEAPPPRPGPPRPPEARPPAPRSPPKPAAPRPVAPATPAPAPVAPALPAAPAPSAPPSDAVPAWRSALMAKLLRAKRYPDAARARGEQGTAYATFTIDRGGHVLSARLAKGSGSYQLDDEAVALIHRAEPLPPLPAEMPGATATLTVPVAFALR